MALKTEMQWAGPGSTDPGPEQKALEKKRIA
jgi:hypothetical protein